MKAAVLREYKKPLIIEQIETPAPGPDEVLIKVEACGVCHSDLHLAEGDWPQLVGVVKLPLILGHEVVGRVIERGDQVTGLSVGDRVGVAWVYWSCGDCETCREGLENLCPAQKTTGATVNGGYAEFLKAKASHAIKVPAGLNSHEAAPLFCAGVTVYRAIKKTNIRPGDRLVVFGVGGLGHLAIQTAQALGAEVWAVDVSEEKLAQARSLGADRTLDGRDPGLIKQIRGLGRAHAAVVTSAAKAAYDSAFYTLRPGGTLVVVGLPAEPLTFPAIMMVAGETRVVGSAVGTRADLREVLEMAEAGKIRCQAEARPLEQANTILDEMRAGRIAGRVVLTP